MKELSDKEMEQMTEALKKSFGDYKKDSSNNIYQNTSILLGILGVLGSIVCGASLESFILIIVGIFVSIVSAMFMYGFGKIIKDLEKTREVIEEINRK